MLTVQALVEQARERQGISWYRLARTVGASDNTVTRWRQGFAPSDEMTIRLAELAGVPAGKALASMHAQREPEGSPVRAAWATLCIMLQRGQAPKARRLSA